MERDPRLRVERGESAMGWWEFVRSLEDSWDDAVAIAGVGRTGIWWLYMAASAVGFTDGGVSLHQVLGVRPEPGGTSGIPFVRTW